MTDDDVAYARATRELAVARMEELREVTAERDALLARVRELEAERDAALDRVLKLESWIANYGQHDWMCGFPTAATGATDPVCICGLAAITGVPAARREPGA